MRLRLGPVARALLQSCQANIWIFKGILHRHNSDQAEGFIEDELPALGLFLNCNPVLYAAKTVNEPEGV